MTKDQLQEKTVAELREMAVKQDIEGRSAMTTKDELVDALATNSGQTGKAAEATPDYPNQFPLAGMTIKGEGKANARLFQTSPDVKEYLTKDEAQSKGFYWAETDEDKAAAAKGKKG